MKKNKINTRSNKKFFILIGLIGFLMFVMIVIGIFGKRTEILDPNLKGELYTDPGNGSCYDSDNGLNYFFSGFVNNTLIYYDQCINNTSLEEWYCSPNALSQIYNCPNGCSNGACINQSLCSDTDGGWNLEVRGTAKNDTSNKTDYCTSSSSLMEYLCSGNSVYGANNGCSYGCLDGRCLPNTCTDSDGGIEYVIKGITSKGNVSQTDYCLDNNTIKEFYCGYGNITSQNYVCKGGSCNNGACVCIDLDGGIDKGLSSSARNLSGTTYDTCSGNILIEAYCSGSNRLTTPITCPLGCTSGYCRCTDSDGGAKYGIKGTATDGVNNKTDVCTSNKILSEFYCSYGNIVSYNKNCAGNCSNGACLCHDSDGGIAYNILGSTTGTNDITYSDSCVANKNLTEYYCLANGSSAYVKYTCPNNCTSGRCM